MERGGLMREMTDKQSEMHLIKVIVYYEHFEREQIRAKLTSKHLKPFRQGLENTEQQMRTHAMT
jgi:hypothetical protein